jgi:hypothetical protein
MQARILPLLALLTISACAVEKSSITPHPRYGHGKATEPWDPEAVSYRCEQNARLTSNLIADLDSRSNDDVRLFLISTQAAWLEVAAAVHSSE